MTKNFISWRRVSTNRQGRSGLGLAAQKDVINYFIGIENGTLVNDYKEVYTGKDLAGCTELQKAIKECKEKDATLIIAKTDRFRNTEEALQIYREMNGKIYFCDLPHTDKFTLTLFFALAEREALVTSIRTTAALSEKKKQGYKLGSAKGCDMKVAYTKSVEKRREKAKTNPNNKLFYGALVNFESSHGKVDRQNMDIFVSELQRLGAKTATGMDMTRIRACSMINKIKTIYQD